MLKKRYFNEIRVLQRSLVIEDLLITVALRYATPPTSLRSAGPLSVIIIIFLGFSIYINSFISNPIRQLLSCANGLLKAQSSYLPPVGSHAQRPTV